MKRISFGLAAVAILYFAAERPAFAQPGGAHAAAVQVVAGHAVPGAIHGGGGPIVREVGYYHRGYPGYYGRHGGWGPVPVYPWAGRRPVVVVPAPRLVPVPVLPPAIYGGPAYYYGPQFGFGYRSPGLSFGFSF
jgi:hypothetical protein